MINVLSRFPFRHQTHGFLQFSFFLKKNPTTHSPKFDFQLHEDSENEFSSSKGNLWEVNCGKKTWKRTKHLILEHQADAEISFKKELVSLKATLYVFFECIIFPEEIFYFFFNVRMWLVLWRKNCWINFFLTYFSAFRENKVESSSLLIRDADKGKAGVLAYLLGLFINFELDIQ